MAIRGVAGVDRAIVSIVAHDRCVLATSLGIAAVVRTEKTVVAIDRFGRGQTAVLFAIVVVVHRAGVPVVTEDVAGLGATSGKITVREMRWKVLLGNRNGMKGVGIGGFRKAGIARREVADLDLVRRLDGQRPK